MRLVGGFSKLLGYSVAVAAAMLVTTAEAKVNKAIVRAVLYMNAPRQANLPGAFIRKGDKGLQPTLTVIQIGESW